MSSSPLRFIGYSAPVRVQNEAMLRQFDALLTMFMFRRKANLASYLYTLKVSRRPVLERHLRESGAPEAVSVILGGTRSVDVFQLARIAKKVDLNQTLIIEVFVDLQENLYMISRLYDRILGRDRFNVGMRPSAVTKEQLLQDRYLKLVIDQMP